MIVVTRNRLTNKFRLTKCSDQLAARLPDTNGPSVIAGSSFHRNGLEMRRVTIQRRNCAKVSL